MSRLSLLFVAVSVLPLGATAATNSPPSQQADCNQYSGSVCYTIESGDTLTHTIPIDFSIDSLQFHDGSHVTIYEGVGLAEQDDAGEVHTEKAYDTQSGSVDVKLGSKRSPRYFDIHYKPKVGWGVVQIFGYVNDATNAAKLASFVASIHPCVINSLNETCEPETPFAQSAPIILNLSK